MKKNEPILSVIMAEYNTNPIYFDQSIKSILNQTFKDFELIIIDDCSNNDTEKMVSIYNDDRIKIIKNKSNIGLAASLNKGIKIARGKYIIRMDTDDICKNDRFEKQVKFAEKHPCYSIVGTRHISFDENGEYGISPFSGEIKPINFLSGTPFSHPTLLIRKDDLLLSGCYPNYRKCQDYAMEMQMYKNGYKGYIMEEPLLKYRQDLDSFKKRKYKARIGEFKIRKKYFKELKLPWYRVFFEVKPLIVGLIPARIMRILKKVKK